MTNRAKGASNTIPPHVSEPYTLKPLYFPRKRQVCLRRPPGGSWDTTCSRHVMKHCRVSSTELYRTTENYARCIPFRLFSSYLYSFFFFFGFCLLVFLPFAQAEQPCSHTHAHTPPKKKHGFIPPRNEDASQIAIVLDLPASQGWLLQDDTRYGPFLRLTTTCKLPDF